MKFLRVHIKEVILYGGVSRENYESIKRYMAKDNTKSLSFFSIFCALISVIACVGSLLSSTLDKLFLPYFISILIWLLFTAYAKFSNKHRYISILCHLFMFLVLMAGAYIGIQTPDDPAVSFIALMAIVSVMFVQPPYRILLILICSSAIFACMSHTVKPYPVFLDDCVDIVIFVVLSFVVSTYVTTMKIKSMVLSKKIKSMSEIDALTGLKNRRVCEQEFAEDNIHFHSVAVLDVNSLKFVNDNFGHPMGDELLCGAVDCMKQVFGNDHLFRVGGDEFIVMSKDSKKDFEEKIQNFKHIVDNWHGKNLSKQSVAVGVASREDFPDLTLFKISKIADERMYEDKRQFYAKAVNDRRNRV